MSNLNQAGLRFRHELKSWILDQIIDGKYKNIGDACEGITKDILNLDHPKVVKNYLYGNRYPVPAKHCPKLSRATGIDMELMNPEVFG